MNKKKTNNVVNNQEDEDGYSLYAGNWIMNENVHGKKELKIRHNRVNKEYRSAKLQSRSYSLSLH